MLMENLQLGQTNAVTLLSTQDVPTECWEYRRDFPSEDDQGKVDALSQETVESQGHAHDIR